MDWKEALSKLNSEEFPKTDDIITEPAHSENIQKAPLIIGIDRSHRKGKTATIIEGFLCPEEQVKEIASTLKIKLGCGGSARNGEILLQGDLRTQVSSFLESKGYKVKYGC